MEFVQGYLTIMIPELNNLHSSLYYGRMGYHNDSDVPCQIL